MTRSRSASPSMSLCKFLATESGSIKDGSGLVGCRLGPALRLLHMTCPLSTQNLAHTKQCLNPGRPAKHKGSYTVVKWGRVEWARLCSNGTGVSQEGPGHLQGPGHRLPGIQDMEQEPIPRSW